MARPCFASWLKSLILEPDERVDGAPVDADFEVEVGSGGVAALAHFADDLPGGDTLAFLDGDSGLMCVPGLGAVGGADLGEVAVDAVGVVGGDDGACGDGSDRCAC